MPRYVALLRGVSPLNAKMPELKRCFEKAGFTEVKTVLGSGNVVFNARAATEGALERKVEAAMTKSLGRTFYTIVRSVTSLEALLKNDPYTSFQLPVGSKRVVTFVRIPPDSLPKLPIEFEDARILAMTEREIFTSYVPGPNGPVFMTLLEKTFGKNITTRTWDTLGKCAKA